jgi:hypothetical protein
MTALASRKKEVQADDLARGVERHNPIRMPDQRSFRNVRQH